MFQPFKTLRVETKLCCTPLWDQIKMNQDERQLRIQLNQGCQTYGPRAKTGPLRGLISPTGWFCKVKTSLFAWKVYPVILQQMVTRFQLLETLTQLLIFCCFSLFVSCENVGCSIQGVSSFLFFVHSGSFATRRIMRYYIITQPKAARRPWAPRIVLEFAVKTCCVLDPWKTSCSPWMFAGVLENF